MRELWEKDKLYSFLRPYVDWCTRSSYTRLEVEGSIPSDGRAVIIAPNHCNTLMDALVVLQARREATVFGARADIFNKSAAARALHFLKILPIARQRDGFHAVAKNLEVIPHIYDVLHHGLPFCIFPEGRHRTMHSLLPIRKGVVRLAVGNAETQPTALVPAGLDYTDYFRYRGKCRLRFGEPIDVNAYVAEHSGAGKTELYEGLSAELSKRISELIVYLPDDEHYEERLEEIMPLRRQPWWKYVLAVLTAPFFVLSALLTAPMWGVAEWICRFKLGDKAFSNSVRYLLRLVGTPLMFLIWAVLGFVFLPWWAAAGLLVYFLFSYSIFYDWLNLLAPHRTLPPNN
ncbi:MAG: 1-acyl-sn-glycerol-3-phosphate acyltransferase [Bacteroidales bacterium]|nr:1-acyl-sn-glycerol-3-phosphate acyltransferase [Bacteroidales bacterium]